jgi:hypothetical protein
MKTKLSEQDFEESVKNLERSLSQMTEGQVFTILVLVLKYLRVQLKKDSDVWRLLKGLIQEFMQELGQIGI